MEAQFLNIGEEIPVMYAERITYAANGVPVEYLEAVWRGDRYDFKVRLSRPG
jgi:GntR family transcriptional regulator